MLTSEELGALLDTGRTLQKEIGTFTAASSFSRSSSRQLIARIDKLLNTIKPYLLNPSSTENSTLGLVIVNLGRIAKNLNDIKDTIVMTH